MISILNLIFPPSCIGCRRNNFVICDSCLAKINLSSASKCIICGKLSQGGYTHQHCLNTYAPERLLCPLSYEGVVRKAIVGSKYGPRNFHALEFLSDCVISLSLETGFSPGRGSLVIPIPLTKKKYKQRGFNQSELIAKTLSTRFGLDYENLLIRILGDVSQRGLNKRKRKENVEGVFTCPSEKVVGRDVVLVDDVCTTGATFLSASKALKERGARFIWCFALAKA